MAADKRSMTGFSDFPGSVDKGTGYYKFPKLKHIDQRQRVRVWSIYVRLIKKPKTLFDTVNWNKKKENQLVIKPKYFKSGDDYVELPAGTIAQTWVETGIETGAITSHAPTYYFESILPGRANQRNAFQHALIDARSAFLKRVEKGGVNNSTGLKKKTRGVNVKYFPMLAKTEKSGLKHIAFPAMAQPKLDGLRCLLSLLQKNGSLDNVVVYSRRHKDYPDMYHMKKLLYPYLNDLFDTTTSPHQSIYLDGELYEHGCL